MRYIDVDLNRVFPGKSESSDYEVMRASELTKMASQYQYVIDLHDTVSNTGIVTIVTRATEKNVQLAAMLPPKKVVIWESTSGRVTGPLTSVVPCGVEIESGPRKDTSTRKEMIRVVSEMIKSGIREVPASQKSWYRVYGKVYLKDLPLGVDFSVIHDFEPIELLGERFFPFLVRQYDGILCYKMRLLDRK